MPREEAFCASSWGRFWGVVLVQNIALLKEDKCEVDAIDLTGSGLHFCDINSIKTIQEYAKPLIDFLAKLADNKEAGVLVGHDIGGACISYAMELYPSKVSKAIFVAATMLSNDQSALDIFSHQVCLPPKPRGYNRYFGPLHAK
ncbi:hypothetical protein BUALT_BualtUnG0010700 [Buddleja alternifolia]|uniref:AB hydrolase-1 domain-containing protein n=1 Tax=Buddleja alternifolia TaxID=168488 RepID=A0AAV6W176_9LAMI|nr:hypothetical protein BUALT_BualtUnG0010700 [Buddleja alternifolia]